MVGGNQINLIVIVIAICGCLFLLLTSLVVFFIKKNERERKLAAQKELEMAREMQEKSSELMRQTIEAMVSAFDAKDAYTHGHSTRVAKYAKKIASLSGMSAEECEDVYLAGLLHDLGKIGIDNVIINKKGKLTEEEYDVVKKHPVIGNQILSKITATSSLEAGAKHHHERFDGLGYPDGLKGKEIPKIARIIAVADAYDAMTSKRSYRNQIAQQRVREEFVKGLGTQFDPDYAKLMIHMIDMDSEYRMREKSNNTAFGETIFFNFDEYKSVVTPGLRITNHVANIKLRYKSYREDSKCVPTVLLYDSLDEGYVIEDALKDELEFYEYGSVCFDGTASKGWVRNMQLNTTATDNPKQDMGIMQEALVQVVRQIDHLLIRITTNDLVTEAIYALNDKSSYVFLALTGQDCMLDIIDVNVDDYAIGNNYIPRIADELCFIDGPAGDIPNLEINGWRAVSSEGLIYLDGTEITFDTISLPSARRMWHCPIICLYTSDDGKIDGPNYKELAMVRLDGESWSEYGDIRNITHITKDSSFVSWDEWKKKNKAGASCKLDLIYEKDNISLVVEDAGLTISNQTVLPYMVENLHFFFTGDQCAITNIRIRCR